MNAAPIHRPIVPSPTACTPLANTNATMSTCAPPVMPPAPRLALVLGSGGVRSIAALGLVEKNKRVRLEMARKTIEKLGGEVDGEAKND